MSFGPVIIDNIASTKPLASDPSGKTFANDEGIGASIIFFIVSSGFCVKSSYFTIKYFFEPKIF